MEEPIIVRIASPGIPATDVYELEGHESIGGLFEFVVSVTTRDATGLDEASLIDQPVSILFEQAGNVVRSVNGIVCAIRELDGNGPDNRATYGLTIVPRAWALAANQTSEAFAGTTVPEILKEKLSRANLSEGTDFELRLTNEYPTREFILQYAESDLQFCSRLAEHLGISYFFEHREGRDVLVFTDTNSGFARAVERAAFRPGQSARGILRLEGTLRSLPARVNVRDYNYRTPTVSLDASAPIVDHGLGAVDEFGAHFKTPAEAERAARVRAEEVAAQRWVLDGRGNLPTMAAGALVTVSGHPRRDGELLVTEVRHRARQTHALVQGAAPPIYENEFRAIPATTPYRPPRTTSRPRIHGTVVGIIEAAEPGQYANVDDQGRYRVRFLFDRSAAEHARASHPIRMAQPHAGPGYGFHFPLRDGVEVLVVFMNGDPDRPVITGAVPNPSTPSTVTSSNARRNVIRTGGGNEINLDDTEGSERIKLSTPHGDTFLQLGAPNHPVDGLVIHTKGHAHLGAGKNVELECAHRFKIKGGNDFIAEAPWVDITGHTKLRMGSPNVEINAGVRKDSSDHRHNISSPAIYMAASDVVQIVTGHFHVFAGEIRLEAGGASIKIANGVVEIVGKPIHLNP